MTKRLSVSQQVYFSQNASEQKNKVFDFFQERYQKEDAIIKHKLLYDGITSLISKNPFSSTSTKLLNKDNEVYLTKWYFSEEPFHVIIVFSDSYITGRRIERICITDIDNKILLG